MNALPPTSALDFVAALRRYVGALEYPPRKSCFVVETADGPRGFCDCAGLPLLGLRDIGKLPANFDANFPGSSNREGAILRTLRRLGKRVPGGGVFQIGDVLVTGRTGQFHVMVISEVAESGLRVIEAPRPNHLVCERAMGPHEREEVRSAFRLF